MTDQPNLPAVDPETAAQLDAADTHESPSEREGTPNAGPDAMSETIERHADAEIDPQTGEHLAPESLSEGQEW